MQILVLLALLQMTELEPQANTQVSKAGLQITCIHKQKTCILPKKGKKKTVLKILHGFTRPVAFALVFFFSHSFTDFPLIFSTGSPKGLPFFLFTSLFSASLLVVHLQTILTTVSAQNSKDHLYSQTHLCLPTLKSEPFSYLLTSISKRQVHFSPCRTSFLYPYGLATCSHILDFPILFASLPRFSHLSDLKATYDEGSAVLILLFISVAEI